MKSYLKRAIIILVILAFVVSGIKTGNIFAWIGFCIITPITNILFFIYNVIGDFGSAIIIFTILVKLCMYPLTKNQLHQSRLMKKLQPELAEIRKNCNGNKQLESLQTMELYKRHNFRPFASILTLFIQLPLFIAIYTAIRVVATPTLADNLSSRAYSIVSYEGSITSEVIALQEPYLSDLADENIPAEEKAIYDFHPYLFSILPLDGKASRVFSGDFSLASLFALLCAVLASLLQIVVTRQQQPKKKGKGFFALMADAKAGKELDESEIAEMSTSQMTFMMPLMMFFIMMNLQGALAFYYLLSNVTSLGLNKFILYRAERTMDDMTDKTILKELKNIKEAEIIENKKTGTKIKISKHNKKRR